MQWNEMIWYDMIWYYVIIYHIILYYMMLYYTILYYIILYYIILYYIILYYIILYIHTLQYIIVHCSTLHIYIYIHTNQLKTRTWRISTIGDAPSPLKLMGWVMPPLGQWVDGRWTDVNTTGFSTGFDPYSTCLCWVIVGQNGIIWDL